MQVNDNFEELTYNKLEETTNNKLDETTNNKLDETTYKQSLFDDKYYPTFIQPNNFIQKNELLILLSDDILKNINIYYEHCKNNNINPDDNIRFGYILHTQLDTGLKKNMSKILKYLLFTKEPNFYIKSMWEIIESGELDKIKVDKIKIKLIISKSLKEITIKTLANQLIHGMRKMNKKNIDYLKNIITI